MNNEMRNLILLIVFILFIGCSGNKKEQNTEGQGENILKSRIENQIGFEFPEFEEVSIEYGSMGFNGDYSNTMNLKFKKDADLEPFYQEIKKRVENPQENTTNIPKGCYETAGNNWRVDVNGEYSYLSMLDCENGEDSSFSIQLNSKDSTITISYGRW